MNDWQLTPEEIEVLEGEVLPPEKPKPREQSELEINKMLAAWKPTRIIEHERTKPFTGLPYLPLSSSQLSKH